MEAVAAHRLSSFRLPLWLRLGFCAAYPATRLGPLRAIRALHACAYFGIDERATVEKLLLGSIAEPNAGGGGGGDDAPLTLRREVSPRGVLVVLRLLPHLLAGDDALARRVADAAARAVTAWIASLTASIAAAATTAASDAAPAANGAAPAAPSAADPASLRVGFAPRASASAASSSSRAGGGGGTAFASARARRRAFDVLCCAAALDLPPQAWKHVVEHLYPFDAVAHGVLADGVFFFGHAAQRKRLSGVSLRSWRALASHLDRVTLARGTETLSAGCGSHGGGADDGVAVLVQTAAPLAPALMSVAHFVAFGGGSAAVDSLVARMQRCSPLEPLLVARVLRTALAPLGIKVRPALSQLICRALDAATIAALTTEDVVLVLEVFHGNAAQRVAVGVIQADTAVALAWDALLPRLPACSDATVLRAARVPIPSSLPRVVEAVVRRVSAAIAALPRDAIERDRAKIAGIVMNNVAAHITLLVRVGAWETAKRDVVAPLAVHASTRDKEMIGELLEV